MTNILQDLHVKIFSNPNKETEFKAPNQEEGLEKSNGWPKLPIKMSENSQ